MSCIPSLKDSFSLHSQNAMYTNPGLLIVLLFIKQANCFIPSTSAILQFFESSLLYSKFNSYLLTLIFIL
mgnify:CR=1 FL=1